jgi:hypothetical protein
VDQGDPGGQHQALAGEADPICGSMFHISRSAKSMTEMGQTRLFDDVDAMSATPLIAPKLLCRSDNGLG